MPRRERLYTHLNQHITISQEQSNILNFPVIVLDKGTIVNINLYFDTNLG
jgi:hypothetical protein